METLKTELSEYIATGYDFDATVDLGNGWEPYVGCRQNLVMILVSSILESRLSLSCRILL